MKFIYLEAGSGAKYPVPDEMISAVKEQTNIPIIVGGGISQPEVAAAKVQAGADFIVTGNILENSSDSKLIYEFVNVIHGT
jgi:geranylgeranylglyceryl phosphate synthase family protein